MNKSILKSNKILEILDNSLIKLPSPVNISLWWNFGSLLGLCLLIQIISGLFLSMHYTAHIEYSFFSIIHIIQDVNNGWLMRLIHINGASFFFICVYMHIGRGLYYGSYKFVKTWMVGVLILLIMMGTAFLGYVLPWGQMSFWGATVITNLMSALPYVGSMFVEWLWGGFSINNATLNRFYTLHFLLPFILLMIVIIHLMFLHETGSNNPLGVSSDNYKIIFHSYYTYKDLLGFMYFIMFFMFIIYEMPYFLGDPENFIMANSLVTPVHIQPEWYFLFAYTILRSIPNKLSGVIALLMSILILLILPFLHKNMCFLGLAFYPFSQAYFWMFVNCVILLTWLGSQSVEQPFIDLGMSATNFYFTFYLCDYFNLLLWDKFVKN